MLTSLRYSFLMSLRSLEPTFPMWPLGVGAILHLDRKRAFALAAVVRLLSPGGTSVEAQGRTAAARSLRCTFPVHATSTWKKDGPPEAAVTPATLVLLFESINTDEGTARLRSGDRILAPAGGISRRAGSRSCRGNPSTLPTNQLSQASA